jgi:hypothetical protein
MAKRNRVKVAPTKPRPLVKRRKSPGGQILCHNEHLVPRRRYNMALKLGMKPSCNECGSTDLQIQGPHEVRVVGTSRRLIWKDKRTKWRKKKG